LVNWKAFCSKFVTAERIIWRSASTDSASSTPFEASRAKRGRIEIICAGLQDCGAFVVTRRHDEDDRVCTRGTSTYATAEISRAHVPEGVLYDDERRRLLAEQLKRARTVLGPDQLMSARAERLRDEPPQFRPQSGQQGFHGTPPQ
jgi:hypothetical protein